MARQFSPTFKMKAKVNRAKIFVRKAELSKTLPLYFKSAKGSFVKSAHKRTLLIRSMEQSSLKADLLSLPKET
ncbi:hypothetical protein A6770_19485 [Nostoc minutum NIES-26]|uniref:Uncharacterized protein n=1 Tax=Nostoc minutum NIES-26 TaxID=1844469 RepID=A0A367R6B1_9NOSO|nr:hypothetical protein A6770_19485 [Nostoc minutum NIES-26]